MRIVSVFLEAVDEFDTRPVEVLYAFLTFAWGTWLLFPGDTFATNAGYAYMSAFAREEFWGGAAVMIGVSRVIGLLVRNLALRVFAAWGGCVIWSMTATGIALYNARAMTVPLYGVLSLCCFLVTLSLMRRYRALLVARAGARTVA